MFLAGAKEIWKAAIVKLRKLFIALIVKGGRQISKPKILKL